MKAAAGVALLLGLALFAALTLYEGAGDVARAIETAGFGVLWIVAIRLAQTVMAGFAWRALLPRSRPRPWLMARLRWVRESINNLLPVAQIGGDVIGARLLRRRGVPGGLAAASVIGDLLALTATQVLFTLLGVFFLADRRVSADLTLAILAGLVIMAPALAGFWLAPRLLAMGWLDRLAAFAEQRAGWSSVSGLPALRAAFDGILRRRSGLTAALAIHMGAWFVGALEIWLALYLLGEPRSYGAALAIESLGHAVKAAGFLIPGAWGVQEGGYIALCAVFGIASPTAIALSLIKRIPDFILGAPGLWLWRRMEGSSLRDIFFRAKFSPREEPHGL
ncbi:lysylphosphatidylglycerol synthase domain-containing protein [Rhodoblastus sp.]|uniref:lysylphosphatidylglycerol synthase domain-containing protein n=1 Tax=Rhodoblastus sp. TaxID=1962975 RepID=UPI003F9B565D